MTLGGIRFTTPVPFGIVKMREKPEGTFVLRVERSSGPALRKALARCGGMAKAEYVGVGEWVHVGLIERTSRGPRIFQLGEATPLRAGVKLRRERKNPRQ